MRRKTLVPYGETTILALKNMASETDFRLIAKIKEIREGILLLTDDHEEIDISVEGIELPDLEVGNVVIVFGKKTSSGILGSQILWSNLDWKLYTETRELESH
ncbi:MAG: hypothetical protein ACFFE8_07785 [Candidatus Heimdallarchaeota archaeon]